MILKKIYKLTTWEYLDAYETATNIIFYMQQAFNNNIKSITFDNVLTLKSSFLSGNNSHYKKTTW